MTKASKLSDVALLGTAILIVLYIVDANLSGVSAFVAAVVP